jgi:hypothetical protein
VLLLVYVSAAALFFFNVGGLGTFFWKLIIPFTVHLSLTLVLFFFLKRGVSGVQSLKNRDFITPIVFAVATVLAMPWLPVLGFPLRGIDFILAAGLIWSYYEIYFREANSWEEFVYFVQSIFIGERTEIDPGIVQLRVNLPPPNPEAVVNGGSQVRTPGQEIAITPEPTAVGGQEPILGDTKPTKIKVEDADPAVYHQLLAMVMGDKNQVEELIRQEFQRVPNISRKEAIDLAIASMTIEPPSEIESDDSVVSNGAQFHQD